MKRHRMMHYRDFYLFNPDSGKSRTRCRTWVNYNFKSYFDFTGVTVEMNDWLETISGRWDVVSIDGDLKWAFTNSQDALMFGLLWAAFRES